MKHPFNPLSKAAIFVDQVTHRPQSPGQAMKEKTTLATYHVARIIAKQVAVPEKVHKGKLMKAQ